MTPIASLSAIDANLGFCRVVGMLQPGKGATDPAGGGFTSVSRGGVVCTFPEHLGGEAVDHAAFDKGQTLSEHCRVFVHEDLPNHETEQRHDGDPFRGVI